MTLSNHLILCRPLLLLPSHFRNISVFSRESSLLMRWPKYWSLRFRICPSSEHSGLISFRMERFDLLAVQGTLEILLQHHNSKASILWRSAFLMVQLSLPYIATGKHSVFHPTLGVWPLSRASGKESRCCFSRLCGLSVPCIAPQVGAPC